MTIKHIIKEVFLYSTGYTYSNLSRLFIRLFVGIMILQFGIRQIIRFSNIVPEFIEIYGGFGHTFLVAMIVIEIVCSVMIMIGFLTRLATIPPIAIMLFVIQQIMHNVEISIPGTVGVPQPVYLPLLFLGIFIYIFLAGPGKISLDYLISLNIINRSKEYEEEERLKTA